MLADHLRHEAMMHGDDDPAEFFPDLIARFLRDQWWRADAECRGKQTAMFFAASPFAAIAICNGCPVREHCESWAETHHEVGVWGGRLFTKSGRTYFDGTPKNAAGGSVHPSTLRSRAWRQERAKRHLSAVS